MDNLLKAHTYYPLPKNREEPHGRRAPGPYSLSSPEQIAYLFMENIAQVERKVFHHDGTSAETSADKRWTLDTYVECLLAVKSPRKCLGKGTAETVC